MKENQAARAVLKLWALSPVRYLVVAGFVALFYLSLVALGISLGIHYFIAILIAQAVAIFTGFPLYRRFVFESQGKVVSDFLRFIVVWSGGAAAGIVLTPLLVEFMDWDPLISQVLAIITISVLSYLTHKFFTFRKK